MSRPMNVLVLTDLSDVAKNAGSYAVQFLAHTPAVFHMLNIRLFNPGHSGEAFDPETEKLALKNLKQRAAELKEISTNKQHEFKVHYSENDLLGATRNYVAAKEIDLIVMGAAHKGHSPHTIIGNHTYEMIKKIRCNVLAVAENCKFDPLQNLILPIDYSASIEGKTFNFLKRRGVAEKAAITVVEMEKTIQDEPGRKFFGEINDRKIHLLKMETSEAFSEKQLQQVQKRFELIVLLGKNIGICDELLHTEHGLCSKVALNLPILVLHE